MMPGRLCGPLLLAALMASTGLASPPDEATDMRSRPHLGAEPDQVFFIIYVLDVEDISEQGQNFTANIYFRLRWKDERLPDTETFARSMPLSEIWNPAVVLANRQAGGRLTMPEVVEVEPDGAVTYRQQYVGPLGQPLDLADFPLDKQSLSIHFVSAAHGPEELEFVPDTTRGLEHMVGGGMAELFSMPDWSVLESKVEARHLEISDTFGAPGFALEFTARRHFAYYLWQMALPLALIVMMSWTPFWVDASKAELQFGIASSTVLTLIAYRFLLASQLPKLPYLTRMDCLTLSGTLLVFLAFLQVVFTSLLADSGRAPAAHRIDTWCRALFPMAFGASIFWSLFW